MRNFFAMSMTKFFRFMADTFFAKRYGHRAVVLETVAGVPGMVAGMMLHFKSLRKMKTVLFQIFTILPDEVSELIFDFDDEQESTETVQLWTYRRGYFYCRP